MGSRGIQRRKPLRALPRLKGRPFRTEDEPPVMWSPGFEANPNSPAGEIQGFWRLTGRGSNRDGQQAGPEQQANSRQAGGDGHKADSVMVPAGCKIVGDGA